MKAEAPVKPSSEDECPQLALHGVLLEIFDVGVLLLGESGIGKSEIALELVRRGHTLVADDAVVVSNVCGQLIGSAPDLTFEHLEVRGLGILNVRDLFGPSSVARRTKIDLCIELVGRKEIDRMDRIGIHTSEHTLLDVSLPKFVLLAGPGENSATVVETAVRVFILRNSGSNSVQALMEKHAALTNGSLPLFAE